jgi:uncharacterized protein YcaQ
VTAALSVDQARRIAVHAQALDGSARDVLDVVRRTGFLQLDPTARVAPTQLLVLWSRLGHYDPAELDRLVWNERKLFEWSAFVYPVEDLPALKARMRNWPRGDGAWSERGRGCARTRSSAATSCASSGTADPCLRVRSRIASTCRGRRAGGRTTAT